eukprot:RCo026470
MQDNHTQHTDTTPPSLCSSPPPFRKLIILVQATSRRMAFFEPKSGGGEGGEGARARDRKSPASGLRKFGLGCGGAHCEVLGGGAGTAREPAGALPLPHYRGGVLGAVLAHQGPAAGLAGLPQAHLVPGSDWTGGVGPLELRELPGRQGKGADLQHLLLVDHPLQREPPQEQERAFREQLRGQKGVRLDGHQHLSSGAQSLNPGRPIHHGPEVVHSVGARVVLQLRRPRVDPHPNPKPAEEVLPRALLLADLAGALPQHLLPALLHQNVLRPLHPQQRLLHVQRPLYRNRGLLEGHHETVSLGLHLVPPVLLNEQPHHLVVLLQGFLHSRAHIPKVSAVLHVRKHDGHRSLRSPANGLCTASPLGQQCIHH